MSGLCRDCFWTGETPSPRCPACGSRRTLSHPDLARLTIAHLDCDAFYASVEKRDDPSLRDRPVIVGGGVRGVVTTCCYIARMSGVRSAMPMFKARRLCPEAVVVKPDFAKYRAESRRIMERLRALTPLVQSLSLDEAWMDLSGTERLHHAAPALSLARLQAAIEAELGITVSIGLAANKFLAKIASDLDKPRGFAVIGAQEARSFLAPRPVSILPGVGPALARLLESDGLRLVADLARAEPKALADRYGAQGLGLHHMAHGRDVRPVDPGRGRRSLSAETTFDEDLAALADLEDALWPLCEKVARQARAEAIAGRVVALKLRGADFRILTRRRKLAIATQTAHTLFAQARALLAAEADGRRFRLIGVGICDLAGEAEAGGDFFGSDEARALVGERAVDTLRRRFGQKAVISGRTFGAQGHQNRRSALKERRS
ncbi:MAG TPA: DNA polymerase IV [Caulobacteraceae bacterium]|nr:DNA polymerase IV [Caulobacteraceae bacterium]